MRQHSSAGEYSTHNVYSSYFAGNGGLMSANRLARHSMLMLLSLLLISYGVGNIRCSTVPDNSTDMLSLLDFKAITNDPRNALMSWNTSVPHCNWEGVNCSLTHPGRVTALNLAKLSLSGPISPSLGNLTFLKILDLSTNGFTGELPPFNRLHKLQQLVLSTNSLQGTIPESLSNCSNLKTLDLGQNFLTGEIPPNICVLSNLEILQLNQNNLTGRIPPSLKNSSTLIGINFADNLLTGSIPDEIGQIPKLWGLILSRNGLSGGIPETLYNHSSLRSLNVAFNMLEKALPSNFGDNLPSLVVLLLNFNKIPGHIPASLGNISELDTLDLSSNHFIGQVPSSFGRLGVLRFLNLQTNKLEAKDIQSWEFLDALSNCTALQSLGLAENQLQGAIPNSIGKLSPKLQQLGLDTNELSGRVPVNIGNLSALTLLDLSNNKLDGPIEGWVEKLKNLTVLTLSGNNFTGPIPYSIGYLSQLTSISLAENEFKGSIPPTMGNLTMLTRLNLSYNNIQGNIPKEIFHTALILCALSYNNLEGPVPPEISNLKHLNILYLSSNQITGDIPISLGNCRDLTIIEMGHNFLTGIIPVNLGGLPTLTKLNLSHNKLSGSIPAELGILPQLSQLDLSYNNLEGGVPTNGVFGNASSVSLRGNRGLCGGVLDLPPCPSISRRKQTQYYLIRVLVPIFGLMSLVLLVYFVVTEKKMARTKYLSLFPLGEQLLKVTYDDLAQATQNFSGSNLIGRGGYGSVYRGKLVQGKLEVAVKVLDLDMHGAEKSFLSECQTLRNIKHRNLVPILTACSTVDMEGNLFKALVYEFMPNGNLDTWLHHKGDEKAPKRLSLSQRINIIVNIADALDYLHNDSGSRSIIHCDVKPSNILLDGDMTAHLGDFGIASFYRGSAPTADSSTISFGVKGTIGYIGPEYAGGGNPSTCGDVYSFGIVILEMLICKRPTDPMFENGLNIVNFVEGSFPDQILQVIDTALLEEPKSLMQSNTVNESEFHQCLCLLLEVALSCTRQHPGERMNMRQAAARVRAIKSSCVNGKAKDVSPK